MLWPPAQERGATLIELVMTIVIISVAIAGVVGAFALVSGRSANALDATRAVELGQLYMDEILSRRYDDATPQGGVPAYAGACTIGPDGSEARADYDDVDDYDGIDESPPANATGNLSGYNGFRVVVDVACAGDDVGLATDQAKRVTVSVNPPGASPFVFTAYRTNF